MNAKRYLTTLLMSMLISIAAIPSSYAQIGQWTQALEGGFTEAQYENYKFITPATGLEVPHGLGMYIVTTDIDQCFFQVDSKGHLTFGPPEGDVAAYLNFKQGTYVYGCLNTSSQNLNICAYKQIKFCARNSSSAQMVVESDAIHVNADLKVAPASATIPGEFWIKKGIDNNMTITSSYDKWMRIASSGGVGIWGSKNFENTNPALLVEGDIVKVGNMDVSEQLKEKYSLFVKKGVLAKSYAVAPSNEWADFVFDPEYRLRDIGEVERFVKDNGHLPDIPSAEEVQKDGYCVNEMNRLLLQKIEELTLYVIRQQEEIDQLSRIVECSGK